MEELELTKIEDNESTLVDELKLLTPDAEILRKIPTEFDFEKDDAKEWKTKMLETMKKLGGVGLSANQVGVDKRFFVIGDGKEEDPFEKAFFNPLVISCSEEKESMKEGCLSYPGLWLMISRPKQVTIRYWTEENEELIETYEGVTARVILHEYDHMLGYNFTQRASKLKVERAMKALNKKFKKHQRLLQRQSVNINNNKEE